MNRHVNFSRWLLASAQLFAVFAVTRLFAADGDGDAQAGVWTVPSASATIAIRADGVTTADAAHKIAQIPGTNDVIVEHVLPQGTEVHKGDDIVAFDRELLEKKLGAMRGDLAVAEATLIDNDLKLDQQMAALVATRDDKRADLAVADAGIATAAAVDQQERALLVDQVNQAETAATAAAVALARVAADQAAGQASNVDLAAAQTAAAQALAGCALPRERLRLFDEPGITLATARLMVQQRQLRADLGLDDNGKPQPGAGIEGRLAALADQQKQQRNADALDRDRVADALHRGERDADDHTPLDWVEVVPLEGQQGGMRVVFAPEGTIPATASTAADGSGNPAQPVAIDNGKTFTDGRGFGWDQDRQAQILARHGDPHPTLALLTTESHWRIHLADGRWRVRIGVGDDRDWVGPLVRLATAAAGPEADALFVARRLEAGDHREATEEITVAGGWLEVICGDLCAKALRAVNAGTVTHPDGVGPGYKVGWPEDSVAYLTEPGAVVVTTRVRQQDAPWLKPSDAKPVPTAATAAATADDWGDASDDGVAAQAALDRLRAVLATAAVTVITPAGEELSATVSAISDQPVALARRPESWVHSDFDLDLNAVEASLRVAPGLADHLRQGEDEHMVAWLHIPAGVAAVPGHLIAEVGERRYLQRAGAGSPTAVAACRAGGLWLVPGLRAGTRLVPPDVSHLAQTNEHAHAGEVIAGKRSPVTMFHSWGRILTLVPDGSEVTAGQVVVTLYNPSIDDQHAQLEQDKRKAQQAFLLAVENRRLQALDNEAAHRATVLAADSAQLDLFAAETRDPEVLAKARSAATAAATVAANDRGILAAATTMADRDPARAAAASATAMLSGLALEKARLDQVAAERGADWIAWQSAAGAFDDAESALSARGDAVILAGKQEQAAALGSKLMLAHALAGARWEQNFKANRELRAPASGRLFYLVGWNDETDGPGKFQSDFYVWGGLPVAEVLDMSKLAFRAELPETVYPHLHLGDHLDLRFPQIDPRRIPATVSAIGRAFTPSREEAASGSGANQGAKIRVFTATLDFTPPAEMQQRLVPGTKGEVLLP